MKTYNIYNNGHSSKINCNENGKTRCIKLQLSDLKDYLNKKVTLQELGEKYFN